MCGGREAFRTILEPSKNDTSVVFGGSSAGGVGAFNAVEWLLDTFDQVRSRLIVPLGEVVVVYMHHRLRGFDMLLPTGYRVNRHTAHIR